MLNANPSPVWTRLMQFVGFECGGSRGLRLSIQAPNYLNLNMRITMHPYLSAAKKMFLASDHAGLPLKSQIVSYLRAQGIEVNDLGTHDSQSIDYPDIAERLVASLEEAGCFTQTAAQAPAMGILVCGTGIGISIAANRHPGVRAALCHNATEARLARQHNDANVVAFGARTMGVEVVLEAVQVFLSTEFEGGRHASRVAKLGVGPSRSS